MHRIDDPTAVADRFNGNPAIQSPTTKVKADWLNDVQENLCVVVEAAGITLDKGDSEQLLQAIKWISRRYGAPAGSVAKMDGSTVPAGYLALDGAEYLRADYPDLVAWYVADGRDITGSTGAHFVVPNYEGYFERAASSDASVDPAGPRAPGDGAQASQNLAHTHTNSPAPSDSEGGSGRVVTGNSGTSEPLTSWNTGSSGGSEARPVNVPLLWCVKT